MKIISIFITLYDDLQTKHMHYTYSKVIQQSLHVEAYIGANDIDTFQ